MKKLGGTRVNQRETLLHSALKNGSGPQKELQIAWDSLGKAKSQLRNVNSKMAELSKPSSEDILWHLPDYLYCLIDQENETQIPRDYLGNHFSRNDEGVATSTKRKVSYLENREESLNQCEPSNSSLHANAAINTDDTLSSSLKRLNPSKKILDSSVVSTTASEAYPHVRSQNNHSSLWSGFSKEETLDTGLDLTSSTAVRDTEIRFLNDKVVLEKKPIVQEIAKPPQLRHVDVIVTNGYHKPKSNDAINGSSVTDKVPTSSVKYQAPSKGDRDDVFNVQQGRANSAVSPGALFHSEKVGLEKLKEILKNREQECILDANESHLDALGNTVVLRKVACGPPAPTYKGFNEPLNCIKSSPVKAEWINDTIPFSSDSTRQTKNLVAVSPCYVVPASSSVKRRGRVVAAGNNEAAKKEIITTNSWRAGTKLQHDLGLTFITQASESKKVADKDAVKELDEKDAIVHEEAALPNVAKDILKDLYPDGKENDKKTLPRKNQLKKKPPPSSPDVTKEKQTKILLYDVSEARKFICKQKEQRRRDQMQKKDAEIRLKTEKLRRLEELSKRQLEAAVKSQRKKPDTANGSFMPKLSMDGESCNDESEDDDEVSDDEATRDNNQNEAMHPKSRQQSAQHSTFGHAEYQPKRPSQQIIPLGPDNYEDLSAQDIVSRFAINSGLTLEDVVTNYSKYANEIIRSFVTKDAWEHKSKSMKEKAENGQIGDSRQSFGSRLESILMASKSLQSRIQAEARKLATDPVMHHDAEISSPRDVIDLENPCSGSEVIFGADLPGSNHQAVLECLKADDSPHSGYSAEPMDSEPRDEAAHFKKTELPMSISKPETCPFYLRPPLSPLASNMDFPFLLPARPVPGWNLSATEADPLSILNIFCKRNKDIKINQLNEEISAKPLTAEQNISLQRLSVKVQRGREVITQERDSSPMKLHLEIDGDSVSEGGIHFPHGSTTKYQDENADMEISDDSFDDVSSVPPILTERSDPWPVTPKSEALTNRSEVMTQRSDAVSYSADFTDVPNLTDVDGDLSEDHSNDHSVADEYGRARSDQHELKKSEELEVSLGTNSNITPCTNSDTLEEEEEESNFSEVTSITAESNLMNQHSVSISQHPVPPMGAWLAEPMLAPGLLEARMLAELNLLESVDEVLHQVSGMERARDVARAQQETVTLAQVLKARQQVQIHEVEAARVKLEKESVEEARRLQARLAEAAEREQKASMVRIKATADAMSSLQDSMHRLTQAQTDAAMLTADAAKKLAETSTLVLEREQEKPEMHQMMMTESVTAAASAAVVSVMQQLKLQKQSTSKRERISSSSEPTRKSSRRSLRLPSARSDRSVKSEKSDSYRVVSSSVQNSEFDSGSESTGISPKRSRKTSSIITEEGIVAGMDLSRPVSAQSLALESDVPTASDISRISKNTRASRTDKESQHTKSIATATDVSINTVDGSSVSEASSQKVQSVRSKTSRVTESVQSEKDYNYVTDYDSMTTEDEMEKSLKEIVPSESQRKKMRENKLKLNLSSASERTLTNGASSHKTTSRENSFNHFNVAMVQQYLKEEAIRQQHKHMLLQLREKALKEKTAAELAWLEQQKQKLRNKGADDRYPQLSKKQNVILRKHKKYQEELNQLKEANRLTLQAQKLLILESRGIYKLQKSVQEVKQRLKNVGADESLPDLDITTDEDPSISLMLRNDETDAAGKDDARPPDKEYRTNETLKKSDRKRLIEHEQKLKTKLMKFEKLLELSNQLENKKDKRVAKKSGATTPSPRPLDSARSIATASDVPASARTDSARSQHLSSISEAIVTEHSLSSKNTRSSIASITEEVSTARSRSRTSVHSNSQGSSEDANDDASEVGKENSISNITQKSGRIHKSKTLHDSKSVTKTNERTALEKKVVASDSEDEFTLNNSVDFSDQSELKGRIKDLAEELKRRRKEAEQLKKEKEKRRLKQEEVKLKQKIKAYDSFIEEAKKEFQSPSLTNAKDDKSKSDSSRFHETSKRTASHPIASSDEVVDTEVEVPSTPKIASDGGHRNGTDHSQPPTRRSSLSVTEEISEDISIAAGSEKVLLDLDLEVLDELNQISGHQSLTPRSARSEARMPESARTLADIPEDLSESQAQSKSQADVSERTSSRHSRREASEKSNPSYTEDFSNTTSADSDKTKEKLTTEASAKLSHSITKTGSSKTLPDGNSTEEDISEEILSANESSMTSEDEEVAEMKINKEADDALSSGHKNEAVTMTTATEDDKEPRAVAADKDKAIVCEAVSSSTLDTLLTEAIREFTLIKKRKTDTEAHQEQRSLKNVSFVSVNEKENFLDKEDEDWEMNAVTDSKSKQKSSDAESVSAVPHSKQEITAMVNTAIDLLWNHSDTTSTSWEVLQHEMVGSSNDNLTDTMTAKSKVSYARLVFDLTAEALRTMYLEDSAADKMPSTYPTIAKGIRCQIKPTGLTAHHIKPTIQEHVLQCFGLADEKLKHPRSLKFRRRRGYQPKKSDQLDELVLQDLRNEENEWIDYGQDELNVKMELTDSIFDSILQETVLLMKTINSKK